MTESELRVKVRELMASGMLPSEPPVILRVARPQRVVAGWFDSSYARELRRAFHDT